jgi:hypothetical protein
MAIIKPTREIQDGVSFNRVYNGGQPYFVIIFVDGIIYQSSEDDVLTNPTDGKPDMLGFTTYAEMQTNLWLGKYGRSTNYFSFREQDLSVQIPAQMYLLRYKLGIEQNENPTMGEVFQSVDPDCLTYIKKWKGINYVIVPLSFSSVRVIVGEGAEARSSSEVEELNFLATIQGQMSGYTTITKPGSTIWTYDELLNFEWDTE